MSPLLPNIQVQDQAWGTPSFYIGGAKTAVKNIANELRTVRFHARFTNAEMAALLEVSRRTAEGYMLGKGLSRGAALSIPKLLKAADQRIVGFASGSTLPAASRESGNPTAKKNKRPKAPERVKNVPRRTTAAKRKATQGGVK